MGLRFRRYFGLLPGIRLNLSKKGASVSVGRPGLTANLSKHGIRKTVSLPGTGLSYITYQKHPETGAPEEGDPQTDDAAKDIPPLLLYGVIFSILATSIGIVALVVMLLNKT